MITSKEEDVIEFINEQKLTDEIKLLHGSKSQSIAGTLFFIVYNYNAHEIIKQLKLVSVDLENIICEYTNSQYELEYEIFKSTNAYCTYLTSHNELEFSIVIEDNNYYNNIEEKKSNTNNFFKATGFNLHLEKFFNYYMSTYYGLNNYLSERSFKYSKHIEPDTYFSGGDKITVTNNAKLTRTIELLQIILKIIRNK